MLLGQHCSWLLLSFTSNLELKFWLERIDEAAGNSVLDREKRPCYVLN